MDNKSDKVHEKVLSLEKDIAELTNKLDAKIRENEVEKALEQLREKALEMRRSTQLSETSAVLFQQLKDLGIEVISSGVGIFDEENDAIELWTTSLSKNQKLEFILDYVNIHVHQVFENILRNRSNNKTYVLSILSGIELST